MEKKSAHCLAFIMDGVDAPRGVASAEREGGSEGHPLISSLTQRSFACMEVGEGNFIACLSVRRSVGWRDGEPVAKIEYVRTGRANTRPA